MTEQSPDDRYIESVLIRLFKPVLMFADHYDVDLGMLTSLLKMAAFEHLKSQGNKTFDDIADKLDISQRAVFRIRKEAQQLFGDKGTFELLDEDYSMFDGDIGVDELQLAIKKIEGMVALSPSTPEQLFARMRRDRESVFFRKQENETEDDVETKRKIFVALLEFLWNKDRLIRLEQKSGTKYAAVHQIANFMEERHQMAHMDNDLKHLLGLASYMDFVSRVLLQRTVDLQNDKQSSLQNLTRTIRFNAPKSELIRESEEGISVYEPSFLNNFFALLVNVVTAQDQLANTMEPEQVCDVRMTLTWQIEEDS